MLVFVFIRVIIDRDEVEIWPILLKKLNGLLLFVIIFILKTNFERKK